MQKWFVFCQWWWQKGLSFPQDSFLEAELPSQRVRHLKNYIPYHQTIFQKTWQLPCITVLALSSSKPWYLRFIMLYCWVPISQPSHYFKYIPPLLRNTWVGKAWAGDRGTQVCSGFTTDSHEPHSLLRVEFSHLQNGNKPFRSFLVIKFKDLWKLG